MKKVKGVAALLLALLLFTSTSLAQSPSDYKIYLPIIFYKPPQASKLVLQLSDFPAGYELDPDKSGPVEIPPEGEQFNVIELYANYFNGTGQQSTHSNQILIFATAQDASNYFDYRTQKLIDDASNNPAVVSFAFVPVPAYGSKRNGFQIIVLAGIGTGYTIMFQDNQTVSRIISSNFTPDITLNEVITYANKSWARVSALPH